MSSGNPEQAGLNVVLSYGDLSHQSGYRTRILGELEHLDRLNGLDPFLLLFDRHPETFRHNPGIDVPFSVQARSAMVRFYPEIARLSRRSRIRVIHAHNLYSAALALSARRLHGYKVILDYHGRIPEEYVFLGKGGEPSRKALESLERWCARHADHVIVVSDKLRDYLIDRYKIEATKISVIACCSDQTNFCWNTARRDAARHERGLAGKLVCTHLGSFFEWYEPELLVHLFNQIRNRVPNAHLLVITPSREATREYLTTRLPADVFTVMSAAHDQVPELLNASDLGFLLLRPSPNIKTSSPAKFSEYVNCGLPVLITSEVGDFSELVRERRIGQVVDESSGIDADLLSMLQGSRTDLARRCVEAGQLLTWQAATTVWQDLLKRVL